MPEYLYLLIAAVAGVMAFFSAVAYRNAVFYSNEAAEIGPMLKSVTCDIGGDDVEYARILKMTLEEYKSERARGRILFIAGQKVCGIAEGLKSPFRWR